MLNTPDTTVNKTDRHLLSQSLQSIEEDEF